MSQGSALFSKIFSLVVKQAWLAKHEAEVERLFRECESDEQVDLISDLLHRFTYLDTDGEERAVSTIADWIAGLELPSSTIQVVATSVGDDADSGQAVLYALKPQLAKRGLGDAKMVNVFARAQQNVPERPNIILVDEFVGTGQSVIGRVTTMHRDLKNNKGFDDASIYMYAYAGMGLARKKILDLGICRDIRFVSELGRGITDHHTEADSAAEALLLMDALENKLLPDFSGVAMPRLGHGQCEALYGRRGGNCPNSVFPVFWWPESAAGEARLPLLTRKLP